MTLHVDKKVPGSRQRLALALATLGTTALIALSPARAQQPQAQGASAGDTAAQADGWTLDLERSSHIVRDLENRLFFAWKRGQLEVQGLAALFEPPFREDREVVGIGASYTLGSQKLSAVARGTSRSAGNDDVLLGLAWRRGREGADTYGLDFVASDTDLLAEGFLDDGTQFYGRAFYRLPNGFEFSAFGTQSGTYDMTRPVTEVLQRLPRSEIAGVETLADRDPSEDRAEDSFGGGIGFAGERLQAHVSFKSGEQFIRGVSQGDDLSGLAGDLNLALDRLDLFLEVDIYDLQSSDGISSFQRNRVRLDARYRFGRYEIGAGTYAQGEVPSFSKTFDQYESFGAGLRGDMKLLSGRRVGMWAMYEENAPNFQEISRVAIFRRTEKNELGVGYRLDEVGRDRFKENQSGAFLYAKTPAPRFGLSLDAHLGFQEDEAYGRLTFSFKR